MFFIAFVSQNTSWDNFIHSCLNSQFTLLPSSDALESILVVSDSEALQLSKNDLLIDQLLEHLSLTFLNSKDDQYSDINERKLLVWLRLYSLKDYSNLPMSVKQLVSSMRILHTYYIILAKYFNIVYRSYFTNVKQLSHRLYCFELLDQRIY